MRAVGEICEMKRLGIIKKWVVEWVHPSWSIILGVIGINAGVVCGIVSKTELSATWLIVGIVGIFVAIFVPRRIIMICAVAGGILIGLFRIGIEISGQEVWQNLIGKEIKISGIIKDDPDTDDSKTTVKLNKIKLADDNETNLSGTIYIILPKNEELKREDEITISGEAKEGFGTFVASMFRPKIIKIKRAGSVLLEIKDKVASNIREKIEEPEASLGLGYVLGVKSALDPKLEEKLKTVGLTHIVVASGANLAILVGVARKLFGKIARGLAFFGSLVMIGGFIYLAGFSASMMRAGIVAILTLVAWYSGREVSPTRIILYAVAGTLLYEPMYIIDVGWLLSFAAFFGILVVGPELTRIFYGKKEPKMIAATLLESLAAGVMCAPILLFFFGQISLISLLANVLILPSIPLAMGLTMLAAISNIGGYLANLVLKFHVFIIEVLGQQTMFLINTETGNCWWFLLYIPIMIWLACANRRHSRRKRLSGDAQVRAP